MDWVTSRPAILPSSANLNNNLPNTLKLTQRGIRLPSLIPLEHLCNRWTQLMLLIQLPQLLQHNIADPKYPTNNLRSKDNRHNQIRRLAVRQKPDDGYHASLLAGLERLLDGTSARDIHNVVGTTAVRDAEDFGGPVGGCLVIDEVRCAEGARYLELGVG